MACTLKEIKASNRSRWIILLTMVVLTGVVSYVSIVAMDRVVMVADKMTELQARNVVVSYQLDKLIDLAKKTASSGEVEDELVKIKKLGTPSPKNLVNAMKAMQKKMDKVRKEREDKEEEEPNGSSSD